MAEIIPCSDCHGEGCPECGHQGALRVHRTEEGYAYCGGFILPTDEFHDFPCKPQNLVEGERVREAGYWGPTDLTQEQPKLDVQQQIRELRKREQAYATVKAWDVYWEAFWDLMDMKYGPQFHQDAAKAAETHFLARGYTVENPPSVDELEKQIEYEYRRLAQGATEGHNDDRAD